MAFGGLLAPRGQDFEFDGLTGGLADHRILLRDHERCWYECGARGIGPTPGDVEAYLRDRIAATGAQRVVFTGASAGGYAALRFGEALGVYAVHAFAPQTFISPAEMRRHREPRWQRESRAGEAARRERGDVHVVDLAGLLGGDGARTEHHVWYCGDEELDVVQVTPLAATPRVRLRCMPDGGHLVVKWLRDEGRLLPILRASLLGAPLPDQPGEREPVLQDRVSARMLARRRARIVKAALDHRLRGKPKQFF